MNPVLAKYERTGSLLCVGLDADWASLPVHFKNHATPQLAFNRYIIEQTCESVVAYKLNTAFYEARGTAGWSEMAQTAAFLKAEYPHLVTICDAKRADIGNTNRGYVRAIFDEMDFDAITLHPYLGQEALAPFLEREDKLSIILCRTSNPGAGDVQDLIADGKPLWQHVATKVANEWNKRGNCALVVGATWPEEMRVVRNIAPQLPFLVPGIGAQGGDVRAVVNAGLDANGGGLMISSSRAIIFAAEPGEAARAVRNEIQTACEAVDAH
jgi:orotidine-5'-phosphate decarboxylase